MHVAIIPDGNRRWAARNSVDLLDVYHASCRKMLEFAYCIYNRYPAVDSLSLFFVSFENLKYRRKEDLDPLFLSGERFLFEFAELATSFEVCINIIGMEELPFSVDSKYYSILKSKLRDVSMIRRGNRDLNILVGYSVEEDINNIVKRRGTFELQYLQVSKPVDLIIRTGGQHRLSGFLPLNTMYSRLVVEDELFPDFSEFRLMSIIEEEIGISKNYGR